MKYSLSVAIVIFFLISLLCFSRGCCQLLKQPTVHIEMDEAGMHRKLVYNVQFDKTLAGMNCEYMLSQHLPPAVYISTDELDDLQRLKMLSAVYPKFVDVEIITEKAKPISVLLRGTPKITETLTLPIHFRYHAASTKQTTAMVVISSPKLYLSCQLGNNEVIDAEILERPDMLYCRSGQDSDFKENLDLIESENCNWQQMRVKIQTKGPLQAEIPVGDANGYTVVLCITIGISWAAAIWTILSTRSVPRRINKELTDEYMLLQQKVKVK